MNNEKCPDCNDTGYCSDQGAGMSRYATEWNYCSCDIGKLANPPSIEEDYSRALSTIKIAYNVISQLKSDDDEIKQFVKQYDELFKTSQQWNEIYKFIILDPDGWDRKNFEYSFNEEKISREVFMYRVMMSTIKIK